MPKISDEKRAERRAQILRAAWISFQRNGLHATTMDDIISGSGLSAGAVYSYYPSKEALILAAVRTSLSGLQAMIEPILTAKPAPSPVEMARQVAGAIAEFSKRDGFDMRRLALLGWAEAQRNEELRGVMQGFYRVFRQQLQQAVRAWSPRGGRHEAIAKALMSAMLGFVVQSAIMGDVTPDQLAQGLEGVVRKRGGQGEGKPGSG